MKGSGTKTSPFKIYTREDFSKIANYPEAYYVQCKNINIKDIEIPNEFSGCYNGNDYLMITEKRSTPVFYSLSHAVLRNISLLCKDGESTCVFSQSIKKTHISNLVIEQLNSSKSPKMLLAYSIDDTSIFGMRIYGSRSKDCVAYESKNYCYADSIIAENNCHIFKKHTNTITIGCRSDMHPVQRKFSRITYPKNN